jgi:hypothetical protein
MPACGAFDMEALLTVWLFGGRREGQGRECESAVIHTLTGGRSGRGC